MYVPTRGPATDPLPGALGRVRVRCPQGLRRESSLRCRKLPRAHAFVVWSDSCARLRTCEWCCDRCVHGQSCTCVVVRASLASTGRVANRVDARTQHAGRRRARVRVQRGLDPDRRHGSGAFTSQPTHARLCVRVPCGRSVATGVDACEALHVRVCACPRSLTTRACASSSIMGCTMCVHVNLQHCTEDKNRTIPTCLLSSSALSLCSHTRSSPTSASLRSMRTGGASSHSL